MNSDKIFDLKDDIRDLISRMSIKESSTLYEDNAKDLLKQCLEVLNNEM